MANEKLEQIEKKIEQLKAQKQALLNREKEKARKERTKRLIQIGAVIDSRLNLNLDEVEKFCDYLHEFPQSFDKVKVYINKQLEVSDSVKNVPKEIVEPSSKKNS